MRAARCLRFAVRGSPFALPYPSNRLFFGNPFGGRRSASAQSRQWPPALDQRRGGDGESRQFLLKMPNPPRSLTGGYKTPEGCAKGFVSQRCGGNRV